MKREAIEAALKLQELKLITEAQCAELVIKSLNGHAAPAIQQQMTFQRKPHHTHQYTMQQITDIVEMYLTGKTYEQIAQAITVRYDLTPVTKRAIASTIHTIRNGQRLATPRYQTPEWQQLLISLKQRLS